MTSNSTKGRGLFAIAVLAGVAYLPVSWLVADPILVATVKGAGVGLLALWAATHARNIDGALICLVLALGAAGDVLLNLAGLTVGALAFLAGHCVAMLLYLRNRGGLPLVLAPGMAIVVAAAAYALPDQRSAAPGIALYALGLGGMMGTAWISRFPGETVGSGALLFVVSDLLIFARMGPLGGSPLPDLLVWPFYFAGQALIAWGVVATLRPHVFARPHLHHRL